MRGLILLLIAGCGVSPPGDPMDLDLPPTAAPPSRRAYLLLWNDARIGHATETLYRTSSGYRYERVEVIAVHRSNVRVESRTRISIETDSSLRAKRVYVETRAGATVTTGLAERDASGKWHCQFGDEPEIVLPAEAEPSELVMYRLARSKDRSFTGPVFLPGFGFASVTLSLQPVDRHTLRATATTEAGSSASTITLRGDGTIDRIDTGDPLSAVRVPHARLRERFEAPEIVDSSALSVRGRPGPHLIIDRVGRAAPGELPGQSSRMCNGAWHLSIHAPAKPNRLTAAILRSLSRHTEAMLDDELDTPTASAGQALALGRGDCTAHARVFAKLARERGYTVSLVTGFRNDGGRLIRHRWAVVETDAGWVTVDPTYGEAPVEPGVVIALATHGDTTREIGMVDEIVFSGLSEADARYVDKLPACSAAPE